MPENNETNLPPGGTSPNVRFHGTSLRGLSHHPQSPSFEGRFGRMFRTLPPAVHDEADLRELARLMVLKPADAPSDEDAVDDEENQGIDAGYTYLGQFIDHDLTFDPTSSLQKENDPDGLINFRTPRFDLDCLYGRGPRDQPYLYENFQEAFEISGLRFQLGRFLFEGDDKSRKKCDLPRYKSLFRDAAPQRALIGDPRNDDNVIVSQLHAMMLMFHNLIVDFLKEKIDKNPEEKKGKYPEFREVQRYVRWHYQWVVLHDFLPTIVGQEMVNDILPHLANKKSIYEDPPKLRFYHWRESPFIPIEFSAAAYRFGHSMIRPVYRLNTKLNKRHSIFLSGTDVLHLRESLLGFRKFDDRWAIDWSLFFDMGNNPPAVGKERLQKSYKIDTSLVDPLGNLPHPVVPHSKDEAFTSLAFLNLLRGKQMCLPSGQAVARFMNVEPLPEEKLKIGKATAKDFNNNPTLASVLPKLAGNAPLWFYILAEAQQSFDGNDATPIRLGSVGGRIVAEVIIGLLLSDSFSFLNQDPSWKPFPEFMNNDKFKMADLIKQGMLSKDLEKTQISDI